MSQRDIKLGSAAAGKDLGALIDEAIRAQSTRARSQAPLWPAPYGDRTYESRLAFVLDIVETYYEQTGEPMRVPDKAYVRRFVWDWHQTRALGVPLKVWKSRRLFISWLCGALELHDFGCSPAHHLLSDATITKAMEHVWRYRFMYENIRANFPSWGLTEILEWGSEDRGQTEAVALPNGSVMRAIHGIPDAFQGKGVKSIRQEENSTYPSLDRCYFQACTLVQGAAGFGNGHVVTVANSRRTLAWKTFKRRGSKVYKHEKGEPSIPPGYDVYYDEQGIRVVRIHYSVDPEKTEAWARNQPGYGTREWVLENEMIEDEIGGEVVFNSFRRSDHCPEVWREVEYKPDPRSFFVVGFDGGQTTLNPAAVLVELTMPDEPGNEMVNVVSEYYNTEEGASGNAIDTSIRGKPTTNTDLLAWVIQDLMRLIPNGWSAVKFVGDATLRQRSAANMVTMQRHIEKTLGIWIEVPRSGNSWNPRFSAVDTILSDYDMGSPRLAICEYRCPILVAGFLGGYHFYQSPKEDKTDFERPKKNDFSHIQDSFQSAMLEINEELTRRKLLAYEAETSRRPWARFG